MSRFIPLFLFLFCLQSHAQINNFFVKNSSIQANSTLDNRIEVPLNEVFFNLEMDPLKNYLSKVGNRTNPGNSMLTLPNADGSLKRYKVFEASVMQPSFQANFPSIRSYAGQGVTHPEETIRFTLTPKGFYAIILGSEKGTQYIKPFDESQGIYSSFYRNDLLFEQNSFVCEMIENPFTSGKNSDLEDVVFNADDGLLRNHRIAISSTGEFSAFYNNDLTEVIAAMVIAVTHSNAVLERDLSVTLTMVDNTSIIFFDPITDPFDNFDNVALLDQNQMTIDTNIGNSNYDIGHVFNTAGGGIAGLATTCLDGFKAWGVTGNSNPDGENFKSVLLHELGHQFGTPHTFNGNAGSCGPNISPSTAVEPGSGSTIMAYPGLCNEQNVQFQKDLYYHELSLAFMWNHITGFGACAINPADTGNSAPVANAGPDFFIPQGTPYRLIGSSMDFDGTLGHTYTWEQFDVGQAGAPTETTASGPLVRSFEGTTNPIRYIPRIQDLLINPGSSNWEKLPAVNRNLNFRLTVRDNDANGGQTDSDEMAAIVNTAAGPFEVTSQSLPNQIVWTPGTTETITWNVAGTTGNGINESNVNILLSTDSGLNYDTVLAANVPNDGSHDIVVPNIDASKCRIMIEAINNIFFNINEAFFAIGDYSYEEDCQDITIDFNTQIPENSNSSSLFPFQINENVNLTDLNVNLNVSGDADNSSIFFALRPPFDVQGFYQLMVYPCNGTTGFNLTFDDEGSPINCNSLNNGDNVIPTDPLSFADGQNPSGNWVLFGGDINVDGNVSTLNSMTLSLCSIQAVSNLSVDNFEGIQDFSLYPNPSLGNFNLRLNTQSNEDIAVDVFDIKGRLIYHKDFTSNFTFEENINLNQPTSGVYIVKVYQGNNSLTKKLIVK